MKMIAYLLAIICVIAAVMYFVMPAGQLPTFMPGYQRRLATDSYEACHRRRRRSRRAVRHRLVHRPALTRILGRR